MEEERLLFEYSQSAHETNRHQDVSVSIGATASVSEYPVAEGSTVTFAPYGKIKRNDRGRGAYDIDPTFPIPAFSTSVRLWGIDEGFAQMLTGLIRTLRPSIVLEVGTSWGRSARAIAEGLAANGQGKLVTVDMVDFQIKDRKGLSGWIGAIPDGLSKYVETIIGKTPEVYEREDLLHLVEPGVDLAFLDAEHTAKGVEEDLAFVESVRSGECVVLVDNARDEQWPEVPVFFEGYADHPHINIETMTGTEIILMKGPKGP